MKKHVVIGGGEVGAALAALLQLDPDSDVRIRELDGRWGGPAAIMHVAIPWSDEFENIVTDYASAYSPELVIIHSTVPIGTSRRLGAVHSPVTGKHPRLLDSLRAFKKWFGGLQAAEAAAIFDRLGVSTATTPEPETTELGKLWATFQYGMLIAMQKEAFRIAAEVGADPDIAYTEFNKTYNRGYRALDLDHELPILRDMPGRIGGHCVIPNLAMTPSRLATLLAELDWLGWEPAEPIGAWEGPFAVGDSGR